MAQAISYASSPPMGADKSYQRSKERTWKKFMNSLEWKSEKQDIRVVQNSLSIAGIPIKVRKGDQ